MNRTELIEKIARETGIRQADVQHSIEGLLSTIIDTLTKGQKVDLRGFGTFKPEERKARTARNPRTGETVEVPAKTVPVFKPATDFKNRVNTK